MGPIGCPETAVGNYCCTLRNFLEECKCLVFVFNCHSAYGQLAVTSLADSIALFHLSVHMLASVCV